MWKNNWMALVVVAMAAIFGVAAGWAQMTGSTGTVTVQGKLLKVMAIGGESTGWAIQFADDVKIEGVTGHSIEVAGNTKKFEKLEGKVVTAKGKLGSREGVETGKRVVLEVKKIWATE